jgi:hypothetical protein
MSENELFVHFHSNLKIELIKIKDSLNNSRLSKLKFQFFESSLYHYLPQ